MQSPEKGSGLGSIFHLQGVQAITQQSIYFSQQLFAGKINVISEIGFLDGTPSMQFW